MNGDIRNWEDVQEVTGKKTSVTKCTVIGRKLDGKDGIASAYNRTSRKSADKDAQVN